MKLFSCYFKEILLYVMRILDACPKDGLLASVMYKK